MDFPTQTVLLVDDSLEDRVTYRRYLLRDRRHSYNILEAQTGEEGLLLFKQQLPKIILLDYSLPDMDGLEFLDEIKNQSEQAELSVIMLTGQGNEQIAAQAMKGGAAEYLVKNKLTPESLRLAIQYALEQQTVRSFRKQAELELQQAHEELEVRVEKRTEELEQANQQLQVIEEELRQSNEELTASCYNLEIEKQRYQELFEFAPDSYLVTDVRGNIQQANQQASILLSVPQNRLIGKSLLVFIAKRERESFQTQLTQLQQAQSWEIDIQPRSGDPIPVTVSVTSIHDSMGQRVGLRWLLRDISECKQVEDRLKRISTALSHAVEGISQLDRQGRYLMVNQAYANAVGYTPEEMLGMGWQRTVHPEDIEMMAKAYQQMLRAGKVEAEARGIRKDGSIFYKQLVMIADYNERKQLAGHYCFMKDISERQAALRDRKQAQEKIREQAALLDIASDAIYVRDLEHRLLFWNSGAERLYGWTAAEAIGKKITGLVCRKISPQMEQIVKTVLEVGSWQGELQKLTKSGKEAIVSSRMTLVRDEAGQPKSILAVDTDITEKKQLEAQFYQAQRLESLGTLASGIAHDLNNILTPILGLAQLLPIKLPNLDEQNRRLLDILIDNAKRGAQLVKQILLFSREEPEKRVILNLENLVEEIERIVKETFPKSIKIKRDGMTVEALWAVSADSTQIYQVLMNLCVNARDAMPNGGILTISAKNQNLDESYVKMNLGAKIGDYVAITISDTGCGMPPQVKERIFEPFFTTKESGKGTGLGLSTVLGIVKNHGGFVSVKSKVGEGSQFQICLPAIAQEATQKNPEFKITQGNSELILVVDDEAPIREITKTTLLNYNYKVITASDGVEALSLYDRDRDAIALVVMDMQMPSLSGLNAIDVLRQRNPQLKIIAISGLAANHKLLENRNLDVQAFLSKPYTIEELLDTIDRVLS